MDSNEFSTLPEDVKPEHFDGIVVPAEIFEKVVVKKSKKLSVRVLNSRVVNRDGTDYYVCVSDEPGVVGYLVPVELLERNTKIFQKVDIGDVRPTHDWALELTALLPDIETVRQGVLKSFLHAGAVDYESLKDGAIVRSMFSMAFPTKILDVVEE